MHIVAYEATRLHSPEEFACLKAACKDDRERAIVLTLAGTGMRVNELCNLGIEDLDFEHGYVHVEVAKGGRPRTVVSPKPTLEALLVLYMVAMPDLCSWVVRVDI